MITETQIKHLINGEGHIAAIVKKMQKETFRKYNRVLHKPCEEETPLYTLRMTPEQIAVYVRYGCIKRNGRFAKLRVEWFDKQRNKWERTNGLRLITDDEGKTYRMPKDMMQYHKTDREYINAWISWAVLDRDEFMNNNSAISIYL